MRIRVWAVGLFLVVGFGLFTAILFLLGSREHVFSKHIEVYTEFANLDGLENGAKVRVSGLEAGEIKEIEIPKTPSGKFRLELQLERQARGMLRADSVASIETEGVVGDKFVSISKGSREAQPVRVGTILRSKEPFELTETLERISGRVDHTLDRVTKTVDDADHLILTVQPGISKILSDGSHITGNLKLLVADLQNGKGPAGLLLKDDRVRQQLQASIVNIQEATAGFDQATNKVNGILTEFQSRDLIAKADAMLQNTQQLTDQLNVTLKQAFSDDNAGENGGSNIRATLSNLRQSTANLADDTEALKHNFFLRGFFKRRGFYNLAQLTPDTYRKAKTLQRRIRLRQWLAANIFQPNHDGTEQLSPAGRQQIDAAFAPVVDDLPGDPIVVEGYSIQGSPSEQFVTSRQRAELVRQYLETHYELNRKNLGIVALGNDPPQDVGVANWDGAAIVIFNAAK